MVVINVRIANTTVLSKSKTFGQIKVIWFSDTICATFVMWDLGHALWRNIHMSINRHVIQPMNCQIYPQMTLSQRIGVVEINTLWLIRYLQLAKKRTKVVSFHRLSGTGMTSLIHLSPLLKCLMTVCPSSLHSCVQGTNFPPPPPPIRTPW